MTQVEQLIEVGYVTRKQAELPARYGGFSMESNKPVPNTLPAIPAHLQALIDDAKKNESEMMDRICAIDAMLGAIESMLTALLKRGEAV